MFDSETMTKYSLGKRNENKVVSEFAIFAQKGAKIDPQEKKNRFCVFLAFANRPIVHSGGISRGRVSGSGCFVTCDM